MHVIPSSLPRSGSQLGYKEKSWKHAVHFAWNLVPPAQVDSVLILLLPTIACMQACARSPQEFCSFRFASCAGVWLQYAVLLPVSQPCVLIQACIVLCAIADQQCADCGRPCFLPAAPEGVLGTACNSLLLHLPFIAYNNAEYTVTYPFPAVVLLTTCLQNVSEAAKFEAGFVFGRWPCALQPAMVQHSGLNNFPSPVARSCGLIPRADSAAFVPIVSPCNYYSLRSMRNASMPSVSPCTVSARVAPGGKDRYSDTQSPVMLPAGCPAPAPISLAPPRDPRNPGA
jgi:hypothetical protein